MIVACEEISAGAAPAALAIFSAAGAALAAPCCFCARAVAGKARTATTATARNVFTPTSGYGPHRHASAFAGRVAAVVPAGETPGRSTWPGGGQWCRAERRVAIPPSAR